MHSGKTYDGRMFIDATYEGDLMAAAGVDYHVGREANDVYGERWNGVQVGVLHHRHHFGVLKHPISPYVVPGDPQSGSCRIHAQPPGDYGEGDKRIQAYCYRMCLTDHADNRVPFPKPDGYDPKQYELLGRILPPAAHDLRQVRRHPQSKDRHEQSWSDEYRQHRDELRLSRSHLRAAARDPARTSELPARLAVLHRPRPGVPADVQTAMRRWGLAKDEFADTGHWPHQLYVREGTTDGRPVRHDRTRIAQEASDAGVRRHGVLHIDSHNVQRYITPEGHVQNEGDIGVLGGPTRLPTGPSCPSVGKSTICWCPYVSPVPTSPTVRCEWSRCS